MAGEAGGIDKELWPIFVDEATEVLASLSTQLEALAGAGPTQVKGRFDALLGTAHNLKGAARVAGATAIVAVAHAVEDALSRCRKSGTVPSAALMTQLRSALGLVARSLSAEGEIDGVDAVVQTLRSDGDAALESPVLAPVEGGHPRRAARAATAAAAAAKAGAASARVEAPAAVTETAPALPVGGAVAPALPVGGAAAPVEAASTVRLEAAALDRLVHFAGEFMVTQGRLGVRHDALESCRLALAQLERSLPTSAREGVRRVTADLGELLDADRQELQRFGYLVSDWSAALKRARMLPVSGVVAQWRRVVSETAHVLGREVRFVADVGTIEIDRQVLDGLRDPLMHLLRNAVDHGIEPAATRAVAGKDRVGTLRVTARSHGSMVELEVSDDGRGLDLVRIKEQALARGLVDADRLSKLGATELAELVFMPGLSTATAITAVSGRGVGLDAVRRRVAELGGHVVLVTPALGGTSFRLEVPATAVSTRGLLVRVGKASHVVPTAYVASALRVVAAEVKIIDGGAVAHETDGQPLRLRWLASLMQAQRRPDPEKLVTVIVTDGIERLGLVVDEVLGEVEFVAKPLPWNVPEVPGVTGAMILGTGAVGVVLDVPRLLRKSAGTTGRAGATLVVAEAKAKPRVLVVDDSLTSRTLERNILTAAGYEVVTTKDGEEGWEAVQAGVFDLMVADVEMPRCTGLELTRRVRAHPQLKALPIVLVTSLDSPGDVAEGAAAGANEYIVKGRFDQRRLLETVARLI
jgi:two-component system chemotaxis sensor kinase CheA